MSSIQKRDGHTGSWLIPLLAITSILSCDHDGFVKLDEGLSYEITREGTGPGVVSGDSIGIHETTRYRNDVVLYSSRGADTPVYFWVDGGVIIAAIERGVQGMKVGERRTITAAPQWTQRKFYPDYIHPDSILIFEIELVEIVR